MFLSYMGLLINLQHRDRDIFFPAQISFPRTIRCEAKDHCVRLFASIFAAVAGHQRHHRDRDELVRPLKQVYRSVVCVSASTARVIYEVPHHNSDVTDIDKHSTSSSTGSSHWVSCPHATRAIYPSIHPSIYLFKRKKKILPSAVPGPSLWILRLLWTSPDKTIRINLGEIILSLKYSLRVDPCTFLNIFWNIL